jgi:hypothetical protein
MAITKEERTFLRNVHRALEDKPLEPDDPLHVRIHETLDRDDPVTRVQRHIELHEVESIQLFSGFSGSGKSTELFRLRRRLTEQGYVVLYANAEDYITGTEPLTIADMLMVIAGGFSDALEDMGIALPKQTFWGRLTDFVERTEIRLTGVDATAQYESPGKAVVGGIKAGLNIKAELKTGSSFRQALQKFLTSYLVELEADVQAFFESGVQAIREQRGDDTEVVFIFDQLEQLRGDYRNWQDVIRSVQQVFTVHLSRLRMPYVHCVYSVPAWLTFLSPRPKDMTMLPTVHLWKRDRAPGPGAWNIFKDVVRRRMPGDTDAERAASLERLFGPDALATNGPVERLIDASGCHVRDLLQLMRKVLYRTTVLPAGPEVVEAVAAETRREFLPIARDDARLLAEIDRKRAFDLDTMDAGAIERLSRFCNGHMVIYFENGESWYDTHPLIREEVERVATEPGANG